ncbi:ATP-dependent DNA ligase [Streptomyces goshikiensis]|uniref:ATP-dependent DNA ligase n=1 Tax=Streptomyces goshikiensis TaxID=1942 RepID=UPI00382EF7CE
MDFPLTVALARPVTVLPSGSDYWYEPKFDGHRTVLRRTDDSVVLYARSGRVVTPVWMDLALAAQQILRPGTVLDGEAVIWRDGSIDFSAAQARAASTPIRARELAAALPASFAAFDLLAHPDPALGDVRGRSYVERRRLMLALLEHVGPPIQAVPATDDRETALIWYQALQEQGIEGIVAKRGASPYRGGQRLWEKVRHSETVDADVVGFTGIAGRPRHLVVRLPDGRTARSQQLTAPLAAQVAVFLRAVDPAAEARTPDGEPYRRAGEGLVVEVAAGTTRHGVVTVVRVHE